jgi:tRNA(Ile)-lysidine synthase
MRRHAMVADGDVGVVAVSGGPDSTCLLDVLERARLGLTLHVAHVDHGLSEGSDAVATSVATRAAARGLEAHVVRAPDLAGPNLQARARAFRLGFFDMVAARTGAAWIATGHTLDDRVETLLARLVHGAGLDGLAGIRPVDGPRVRPLIDVRRAETRAYCNALGLEFVDDAANADPRFERTAVRTEVLGAIERRWGDGAVRAIAASSQRLGEDAAGLALLAERAFSQVATTSDAGTELSTEGLRALPRALRRRVLELAVGRVRDRSGGIEAALDALEQPPREPQRFAVASGVEIALDARAVVVRRMADGRARTGADAADTGGGTQGAEAPSR